MTSAPDAPPVLQVHRLDVGTRQTPLVKDVDLVVRRGERVGLIGESGSGKTLTALAVMGLLPDGVHVSGSVRLADSGPGWPAVRAMGSVPHSAGERDGAGVAHLLEGGGPELIGASERELARLRGRAMAMVFQEPMTALNPTVRVGAQVAEVMTIHHTRPSAAAAWEATLELLSQVQLPDPARLARAYPHQLSGGQRQRVVLAMALANDPALLICDEPTTALDVTVQAQVLDLIVRGVEARGAALLFITHDLAVVAAVCERVLVMYGGRVVEAGPVREILTAPHHPYTQGLLAASDLDRVDERGHLATVAGSVPPAGAFPAGCVFRNRCVRATRLCESLPPWTSTGGDRGFACFHPLEVRGHTVASQQVPAAAVPGDLAASTGSINDSPAAIPAPAPVAATAIPESGAAIAASDSVSHGALPVAGSLATPAPAARRTAPIISVRSLARDYRRPRSSLLQAGPVVHALRGVSFDVAPGERFGIVGESGSGKSTLLRLLAGLEQPTTGEVSVLGRSLSGLRERQLGFLRDQLQLVFQDPMSSLDPRMRVRDIVAEPLVAQGRTGVGARVAAVLTAVGLAPDAADRYPHQFSGGQRQRISIARALAPSPSILVADEPVSALDVSLRAQVLNLIADLVDGLTLTLVFVSHDLAVVRHMCDRVAVMHDGEIVELGPTEQVYNAPEHPYTQQLVAAVPTLRRALAGTLDDGSHPP